MMYKQTAKGYFSGCGGMSYVILSLLAASFIKTSSILAWLLSCFSASFLSKAMVSSFSEKEVIFFFITMNLHANNTLTLGYKYSKKMANKYTAFPVPPKTQLEHLYNDRFMTHKEIGEHYGTTAKVVKSWFDKLGIISRVAYKRNQTGENNASWKGGDACYSALHARVQKHRGKANYCSVCGAVNSELIYEWANLTGNYSDIFDYEMMCKSCHSKYDNIIENIVGNNIRVNMKVFLAANKVQYVSSNV